MIIAIDGPAGAGKSTVCKILANRLGFVYLDTGAMYRAVAWAFQTAPGLAGGAQTAPDDERLGQTLAGIDLRFALENDMLRIFYGQRTLSEELRSPEITQAASRISRLPAVREFLVAWQRKLAAEGPGIVAEGRDTATVVFPQAELKVYLTADLATRAARRCAEYAAKGLDITREQIELLIRERDEADSRRDHSPMRPAKTAFLLDTSGLSIEQVVDRLAEKAQQLLQTVRRPM